MQRPHCAALQKTVYYAIKHGKTHAKRPPFATRKTAFCNAADNTLTTNTLATAIRSTA